MLVCFYCVFMIHFLLQPCLQARFPFQDDKSWWCELQPIKPFKVQSGNMNNNQGALKTLWVFISSSLQILKCIFTQQPLRNHRSRGTPEFDGYTLEERCNRGILIFAHVKKRLLTWHFLTREGYSRGEESGREKVKYEGIQKRSGTMRARSFQ